MPEREDTHLRQILRILAKEIPDWEPYEIDTASLRRVVKAIEENNRFSERRWSDWTDAEAVEDVYGIILCDVGRVIVERAIDSDGATLPEDLREVRRLTGGHREG